MIIRSHTLSLFLLIFLSSLPFISAATPTSFCKCTCFSNSTIIPLGPPKPHTSSNPTLGRRSIFTPSLFSHRAVPRDNAGVQPAESHGDKNKSTGGDKDDKKFRAANCNDCNRKFCLDYHLPMCKGAKEDDVVTTCFQRESNKDKAVVLIFIVATVSLLVWAALKPWAERWIQAARERRLYIPISSREDNN
ncbi:uncharacterized protein CIMG_04427 [Coccidioides immitis RS]|uniref:Uncharacterized protein n=3 Tax=Coccidioides immitis TaxID=5501 RepID=J3KDG6_COCIM|nr:uncharacterized protein CIMG_04427 [Coccidioides immitis RS]EAS33403.3 hypothetical protein CIMG_04427 [Coccidioides immitis RS]KMU79409.1 hypothetical protein CISG_07840 [Coccidioides immitis RMSCC 3703]KMU90365.1 hypothetical protein CIHG_08175 [Coccidioides immitis H538.4]TPX21137.1 hypothetical protein DIZ76_015091 [Coccidioides immitis]